MRLAVAWTALLAAGSLCACSHSDSTVPPDAASDTTEDQTALEDALLDSGADGTSMAYEAAVPSPLVGVRVANFSSAPPFDLCFAAQGTTNWIGPMFAGAGPQDPDASAQGVILNEEGGVSGLGFPGVSAYFYLPLAQYEARWAAAGSPQCPTVGVVPDTILPMQSDGGRLWTVAWFDSADAGANAGPSDAGRSWEIVAFPDDVALSPDAGSEGFAVRFINAAPSVALANFGNQIGTAGTINSMFLGVPYPAASQADETYALETPYVDSDGFLLTPPTASGFAFVADVAGFENLIPLATGPSSVAAGAVVTVVLLARNGSALRSSDGGTRDAGAFALLQCVDNAGTLGVSGACGVISQ
jgi:hypothetical protein